SDAKSLSNWNPPFPFDAKKIRDKDEQYWDEHRTTPKAFVSLETGRKLWGSRFGDTTTFILDVNKNEAGKNVLVKTQNTENTAKKLQDMASDFGFVFQPVKQLGLQASTGTTPFNVLFISFSFFIIAAALMLVALLFQLSVERKVTQLGTLLAVGLTRRRIFQILTIEGVIIAVVGGLIGVPFGVAYANLMIYGLTHWWVEAIVTPFLTLHITAFSLNVGFASSVVLAVCVIFVSLRSLRKRSVLSLINGVTDETVINSRLESKKKGNYAGLRKIITSYTFAWFILVICILTLFFVCEGNAVSFFLAGMLILCLYLYQLRDTLLNKNKDKAKTQDKAFAIPTLYQFAVSNASRNATQSILCVGLLASTIFLVLSVSAFKLDSADIQSTGGFTYVAETLLPVYFDLNTEEGRDKLSMQTSDSQLLYSHDTKIYSFRVRPGDNAGCLNLYQPKTPRILGVPNSFVERGGFFSRTLGGKEDKNEKWALLEESITTDKDGVKVVPVILDANTAMYSLHLYKGVGEIYEIEDGKGDKIRCKVAALLTNSLLQGDILMSEKNLVQLFPEVSGYNFFLVQLKNESSTTNIPEQNADIKRVLTDTIGDFGLTLEPTKSRLARLFAVQNTYLATFKSLGGIGILLGTFGLAVVQLRNVTKRRKELALMQSFGFSKKRVISLLFFESTYLLFQGVMIGSVTAFWAIFPQLMFVGDVSERGVNFTSFVQQFAVVCLGLFVVGIISNLVSSLFVLKTPVAKALANE
ncbi:MAG: ABC transporter permease, partial [Thermoguttaceae bacterium]